MAGHYGGHAATAGYGHGTGYGATAGYGSGAGCHTPAGHRPVAGYGPRRGNEFHLIVVLFVLLIIIGCGICGGILGQGKA